MHSVNTAILLVSGGDVVEFIGVVSLHEQYGLLQFIQILTENRNVETVHKLRKVFDVLCQCCNTVRIDTFDFWSQWLSLDEVLVYLESWERESSKRLGIYQNHICGVAERIEVNQLFNFSGKAE